MTRIVSTGSWKASGMAAKEAGGPERTGRVDATRAAILAAAAELMPRFTISRLTMDDVARRAGLTRQTIYNYFRSKNELTTELIALELTGTHIPAMRKLNRRKPTSRALTDLFLKQLEIGAGFALFDPMLDPSTAPSMAELLFASPPIIEAWERIWFPILKRYDEAGLLRRDRDRSDIVRWISYNQFWLLTHPTVLAGDGDQRRLRTYVEKFIIAGIVHGE